MIANSYSTECSPIVGPGSSRLVRVLNLVSLALLALACAGCGGSDQPASSSPAPAYTIGGTVSGLTNGSTLTLLDNGSNSLSITSNGKFAFANSVSSGSTFAVTLPSQPTHELCTVSNGSGTVASAAISTVSVTCSLNYPDVVMHSFGANGTDGFFPKAALLLAADGNLYGTTTEG